jgi:hypothetical protein
MSASVRADIHEKNRGLIELEMVGRTDADTYKFFMDNTFLYNFTVRRAQKCAFSRADSVSFSVSLPHDFAVNSAVNSRDIRCCKIKD